jgi:hypothetical protein
MKLALSMSYSTTALLHYIINNSDRLRVFENRVLRRIFGPKREKVAGGWRRLHDEELHNLFVSSNIIRVMKLRRMRLGEGGHVARIIAIRNVCSILL